MTNFKNNVQKEHKKKTTSYISLPYKMVEDIKSLNLSKINTDYCYKFVGIIMRNNWMDDNTIYNLTEIPTAYIKKAFNDIKYTEWLFPLLESEIILRDNIILFNNGKSKSYNYFINNKYINYNLPTLVLIDDYLDEALLTVGYSDIVKQKTTDIKYYNWFKEDMESLTIDYNKLDEVMKNEVSKITLNKFAINEEILDRNILMKDFNGKFFSIPRENAIERATEMGKILIKDKKQFKIIDKDQFIGEKIDTVRMVYSESIENLRHGNYRASRNTTNNRLDTNLTNMCSELTNEICNQNGLVQIDLNNSQFALLSHILKSELDTPDFKLFKRLSITGELYDYIKNNIGLDTRKEGKQAAFEILFSSRKNNTTNKKKLEEIFPSVIKWIDNFKAKYGNEEFCIMLQKYESNLFIDEILVKIKKKKMFCLTKHDSLIIREENIDEILDLFKAHLSNLNLEYNLDITHPEKVSQMKENNTKKESFKLIFDEGMKYNIGTMLMSDFDWMTKNYFKNVDWKIKYNVISDMTKDTYDEFWNRLQELKLNYQLNINNICDLNK